MKLQLLKRLLQHETQTVQILLALLMVLVAVTEGIGLLLLVPIIDQLQSGSGSNNPVVHLLVDSLTALGLPAGLGGMLLAFLALTGLREWLRFRRDTETARLQFKVVDHHRERCFRLILGAEWSFVNRHDLAHYGTILVTDINRIGQGFRFALNALATLVLLVVYLVAAMTLSPWMTLVALVSAVALLLLLGKFRSQATRLGQALTGSNKAIHGCMQQSLSGLKMAKILGSESRLLQEFHTEVQQLRMQQLQFQRHSSAANALMQAGAATLLVAYLYAGFHFWHIPLAELAVLAVIMARMAPQVGNLQQQWMQWLHALPAAQDVFELQDSHQRAAEPAPATNAPQNSRNEPAWPVRHCIELKNVDYRYAGRHASALNTLSLVLPAGSITVITGSSGAGKSTLADLLLGLIMPTHGSICIDGETLQPAQRQRWRQAVACVPQDTFLFNASIRQNLMWAKPDASEMDLHAALKLAGADFVLALPDGLDTQCGERGTQLSGGERQRIALARALLNHPALLLLDEPTSALDSESEQHVLKALKQLRGHTTLLIISHRPALLAIADQVLTLEQGSLHPHRAASTIAAIQ